jgi:hypothetical protein
VLCGVDSNSSGSGSLAIFLQVSPSWSCPLLAGCYQSQFFWQMRNLVGHLITFFLFLFSSEAIKPRVFVSASCRQLFPSAYLPDKAGTSKSPVG